jgi:hypothetical protein
MKFVLHTFIFKSESGSLKEIEIHVNNFVLNNNNTELHENFRRNGK